MLKLIGCKFVGKWDPNRFTVDEIFQATIVILELAILEQRAQILGGIAMFDMEGLSMNQAWYMTPSIAHKMVQLMVVSVSKAINQRILEIVYVLDLVSYENPRPPHREPVVDLRDGVQHFQALLGRADEGAHLFPRR